jgi:hypothetical protein
MLKTVKVGEMLIYVLGTEQECKMMRMYDNA